MPVAAVVVLPLPLLRPGHCLPSCYHKSGNTLSQVSGRVIANRRSNHDINRQLDLGAKHQLTRRKASGHRHTRVDCHLNLWQTLTPLARPDLPVRQQTPYHLLQGPVGTLSLTIRLWVVCRRIQRACAQQSPQLCPERTGKPRVAVVQHLSRYPKTDTTWLKNKRATTSALSSPAPICTGTKRTYLVNLSTQHMMPV